MGGSYPSAEKQSVYSTAPADWASKIFVFHLSGVSWRHNILLNLFRWDFYSNEVIQYHDGKLKIDLKNLRMWRMLK